MKNIQHQCCSEHDCDNQNNIDEDIEYVGNEDTDDYD